MKNPEIAICIVLATLIAASPAFSQNGTGQGQAVVTVLPKQDGVIPPGVANQDLGIKVNGKPAKVTKWAPFQSPENAVELVLLIDGSARSSLGTQTGDITRFIKSLPPNTTAAIAYMEHGRALFSAPLSADHAQVLRELHLPGGSPGSNASPYFCLSDLAKHWPSKDVKARREVVMITDGADGYGARYDPDDPYVQAAIDDAGRARVVVYSIYWQSGGGADRSFYESGAGPNLLDQVARGTGGKSFWTGIGNPVSFEPYLGELTRRLRNQYELGFSTTLAGKPQIETFQLKLSAPGTEIEAPGRVIVFPADSAKN